MKKKISKKYYWTAGIMIILIIISLIMIITVSNSTNEPTECYKGKLLFDDIISNPNKYNNQTINVIATLKNYSSVSSGGNVFWGSNYIFNFEGYKKSIELEFLESEGNFEGNIVKGPGWICYATKECEDSIINETKSYSYKDCDCYQTNNQTWKCDCDIRTTSWNFHASGFEEGAYEITWSNEINEKYFVKSSDVGRTLKLELFIIDSEIYLNRYEFFNC